MPGWRFGVPNSLGPGELLVHYGTKEQKDYYLPRLADGGINRVELLQPVTLVRRPVLHRVQEHDAVAVLHRIEMHVRAAWNLGRERSERTVKAARDLELDRAARTGVPPLAACQAGSWLQASRITH